MQHIDKNGFPFDFQDKTQARTHKEQQISKRKREKAREIRKIIDGVMGENQETVLPLYTHTVVEHGISQEIELCFH